MRFYIARYEQYMSRLPVIETIHNYNRYLDGCKSASDHIYQRCTDNLGKGTMQC